MDEYTYEYYDYPRDTSWEEYDHARDTFIDRIAGVEGVVSVYESGKPSTLGISDIDIIVVVEDDVADPEKLRSKIEDAKIDEYYFFHGPEVLTEDVFHSYYSVLPQPKTIHHLHGEELSFETNRKEFTSLVYLVDSLNRTYPREFLEFAFLPSVFSSHRMNIIAQDLLSLFIPQSLVKQFPIRVDVRLVIHRLNSLRNDMNLFMDQYGRSQESLEGYDEAITELRENWYSNPEKEEALLNCLARSISACFSFLSAVDSYLTELGVSVPNRESTIHVPDTYPNYYLAEWDAEQANAESVSNFAERGIPSCVLPETVLTNVILRRNPESIDVPDGYLDALTDRDRVSSRRDESMETYKYHPWRAQYLNTVSKLFEYKIRAFQ